MLQLCQDPAIQPPVVDASLVPELPLREHTAKDPAEDEASLKSSDLGETPQHGAPKCRQEKGQEVRDISENAVRTSSGRVVHKPERYRK